MHDWGALVCKRLPKAGLSGSQHEETITELAGHLEECYEEQRAEGASEAIALALALSQIENWRTLARRIERAKRKDDQMNQRTKTLWLPGLLNVTAACMLLAALAHASARTEMILAHPRLVLVVYPFWLAGQPLIGAIGAYASRRAGGTRLARLAAGLFPSIILAASICAVFVVRAFVFAFWGGNGQSSVDHIQLWQSILGVIIVPGLALLVGALPFLRSAPSVTAGN